MINNSKNLQREEDNIKIRRKKENFLNNILKNKAVIITVCLLFSLVIIFCFVTLINKLKTTVYNGIYYNNVNMSSMSKEGVVKTLESYNNNIENIQIELLQNGKKILEVNSYDIDFHINVDETAKKIMQYGRSNNVFKNNIDILKAMFKNNIKIDASYTYNEEKVDELYKNVSLSIEGQYSDDSYSVDEINKKLVVKIGKTGNYLEKETFVKGLIEKISTFKNISYELPLIEKTPKKINVDEVFKEVSKEAKDAYIDETNGKKTYIKEEDGVTFELEKLKEVLNIANTSEGKEYTIDLIVTKANVKITDLTYDLYNDKITTITTYFNPTLTNRSNNLEVAASILDGAIVMPNETFSFNENIGDITESKGYLPASTFKGGTMVDEIGGGICQVSSMFYNAALKANLEIVERYQHGLPVGYIEPSLDATVYSPSLDLKFKNTRKYPVKFQVTYSKSGILNISVYGTKEEIEYDIELVSKYLYAVPYKTNYTYNASIAKGEQKTINAGVNGYVSEAYIIKYLNGVKVYEARLSKDTYKPQDKNVIIGVKEENNVNIYN